MQKRVAYPLQLCYIVQDRVWDALPGWDCYRLVGFRQQIKASQEFWLLLITKVTGRVWGGKPHNNHFQYIEFVRYTIFIMCGRFAQGDLDAISSRYKISVHEIDLDKAKPRYNVAPFQNVPVVTRKDGQITLSNMRWGLVPSWAKDEKFGYKMINSRAETVSEKPIFQIPLKSQRCLVPIIGFYEWKENGNGKIPYYIKHKSGKIMSLAGIFDVWIKPHKEPLVSFSVITTKPSPYISEIHDRMPVILEEGEEKVWLDNRFSDLDELTSLFDAYPDKYLEYYPISKKVNNPENEGKEIISKM